MRNLLRIATGLILIAVYIASGSGCDDRNAVHGTAAVPESPKGPTTAEILATPRKPLALGAFPLTFQNAPETWEVKASDGTSTANFSVEGLAPHGQVHIALTKPPLHYSAQLITLAAEDAQKQLEAHHGTFLLVNLRKLDKCQILEKRSVRVLSTTQPATEPAIGPPTPPASLDLDRMPTTFPNEIDWSLLVFVPKGRQFEVCMLEFLSLSEEQYSQDRSYLEAIVNSLIYDPSNSD